jgi:hypothetical protein
MTAKIAKNRTAVRNVGMKVESIAVNDVDPGSYTKVRLHV